MIEFNDGGRFGTLAESIETECSFKATPEELAQVLDADERARIPQEVAEQYRPCGYCRSRPVYLGWPWSSVHLRASGIRGQFVAEHEDRCPFLDTLQMSVVAQVAAMGRYVTSPAVARPNVA